jgi:predicted metal-binding membrane protein
MALSMPAMMAASAMPFFIAYGRDGRRAAGTAAIVLIYVAAWALIGFALNYLMGMVMSPSSLLIAAAAVAVAVGYALTPWGRWARDRCREMALRQPRGPRFQDALADGAGYTACCMVCSAGIMPALVVIGMSNPLVIVAGAAVMLLYKTTPWPVPTA